MKREIHFSYELLSSISELNEIDHILSPCGSCRQVMLESENRQKMPIRVILINQDDSVLIVNSAKDFLPFGFGK